MVLMRDAQELARDEARQGFYRDLVLLTLICLPTLMVIVFLAGACPQGGQSWRGLGIKPDGCSRAPELESGRLFPEEFCRHERSETTQAIPVRTARR